MTNQQLAATFAKYYGVSCISPENPMAPLTLRGWILDYILDGDASFRLQLRRLCNITDADAIEVCKLYGYVNVAITAANGRYVTSLLKYGRDMQGFDYDEIKDITDYLRAAGYDCDNLIDGGYADEITDKIETT